MNMTCESCDFKGDSKLFREYSDGDGYHEICYICKAAKLDKPGGGPHNLKQMIAFVGNLILEEIDEMEKRIKDLEGICER